MRDSDVLDMITDMLVNNFGEDDDVTGSEAVELLERICALVDARDKSE